jgi:phosphoketolase
MTKFYSTNLTISPEWTRFVQFENSRAQDEADAEIADLRTELSIADLRDYAERSDLD